MTRARQILSGSVYMVTRRCSERRYFLASQYDVNQLFGYLLASKALEHDIELLGATQMSNHYHLVVHDRHGNLPKFLRDFNALTARGINRLRGRSDALWDARQTAVTELCDADSVMRALVYVACNPVAAGLVDEGNQWDAVRTSPEGLVVGGQTFTLPLPFKPRNGRPDAIQLSTFVPPTHSHLTREQFASLLDAQIRAREAELRRTAAVSDTTEGRNPPHWTDAPKTDTSKSGLVPSVMAGSIERRRAVLERRRAFIQQHAFALARFAEGDHAVIFPGGTWKAVQVLGASTEPAPAPAWRLP